MQLTQKGIQIAYQHSKNIQLQKVTKEMKFKLKSQCAGEVLEEHTLQHRTDGTGTYKNLCAEYLTIIK